MYKTALNLLFGSLLGTPGRIKLTDKPSHAEKADRCDTCQSCYQHHHLLPCETSACCHVHRSLGDPFLEKSTLRCAETSNTVTVGKKKQVYSGNAEVIE